MKERIVIKDTEQIFNIVAQFPTQLKPKDFEHEVEQVPETFEDLKELCKDLEGKNVFIINAGNCIEFNGLYFWKDGSITTTENNEDIWATKTNLTPDRMWSIIKGLIGEE